MRWLLVRETRVIEVDDPVSCFFDEAGKLQFLPWEPIQ
jgi:hypothetical protein